MRRRAAGRHLAAEADAAVAAGTSTGSHAGLKALPGCGNLCVSICVRVRVRVGGEMSEGSQTSMEGLQLEL